MIYRPYRETLKGNALRFYDDVMTGFLLFKNEIHTVNPGSQELIERIIYYIRFDNPLIFYTKNQYSYAFSSTEAIIYMEYTYTKAKAKELERFCVQEAKKIIGPSSTTPLQMEINIHDKLCEKIIYKENGDDSHNIIGVFLRGESVCEGISKAAKLCFDFANLKSTIVICEKMGDSDVGHAWNAVNIGTQWYHLDVTWDNSYADDYTLNTHNYYNCFNITDKEIEMSRTIDMIPNFIKCFSNSMNYHKLYGLVANDYNQLREIIKKNLRLKKKAIHVKCSLELYRNVDKLMDIFLEVGHAFGVRQVRATGAYGVITFVDF